MMDKSNQNQRKKTKKMNQAGQTNESTDQPSQSLESEVIIVGGGLVGLTLAAALAQENIKTIVVESETPVLTWPENSLDPRVSALNLASERILNNLHIWPNLSTQKYAPMRRLVVWDHLGQGEIGFDSVQAGFAQCGYIVENRELISHLWQQISQHPAVELFSPCKPQQLWRSKNKIQLILDHQMTLYASLIVGADGGQSWLRQQMNISHQQLDFQQQALVCVVKSEYPHQDTAWQNFLTIGPIAFLPLVDKHQGVIVWSIKNAEATRILALSQKSIEYEITNALADRLGAINLISEVQTFPLSSFHANQYVENRMVLVGDAAHKIHPLAGQGANLGLMDAACLSAVISDAKRKEHDIGSLQTLKRYERQRKTDNLVMEMAMNGFNTLFSTSFPWLAPVRSQGLKIADRMGFFKNWVMRYAMGCQYFNQYKLTSRP